MAGPQPCHNVQNQSLCVKPSAWGWGHPSWNPADPFEAPEMTPAPGKKPQEGMMFGWNCGPALRPLQKDPPFSHQAGSWAEGGAGAGARLTAIWGASSAPPRPSAPSHRFLSGRVFCLRAEARFLGTYLRVTLKPGTAGSGYGTNGLCDLGEAHSPL